MPSLSYKNPKGSTVRAKRLESLIRATLNGKISKTGGRIFCGHCWSQRGFITRNRYPFVYHTCIECGAKEKMNNKTGEVVQQVVDMMSVDRCKATFNINL